MLWLPLFATATSGLPSPLKSATATLCGEALGPIKTDCGSVNTLSKLRSSIISNASRRVRRRLDGTERNSGEGVQVMGQLSKVVVASGISAGEYFKTSTQIAAVTVVKNRSEASGSPRHDWLTHPGKSCFPQAWPAMSGC